MKTFLKSAKYQQSFEKFQNVLYFQEFSYPIIISVLQPFIFDNFNPEHPVLHNIVGRWERKGNEVKNWFSSSFCRQRIEADLRRYFISASTPKLLNCRENVTFLIGKMDAFILSRTFTFSWNEFDYFTALKLSKEYF